MVFINRIKKLASMFTKCNLCELKTSLFSSQALHFQMAKFYNFNFQNGHSFQYFISTMQYKGEDRHSVVESFVNYLENRNESSTLEFDAFKNADFCELPEKIKAKFGDVALFAVMDGHSTRSADWWFDQINYNLPLALAKTFEIKMGELDDPAEILEAVAKEFPLTLHNALKDHLITMRANDSGPGYDAFRSGTTLSFLIFTHELAASGIVGDSPVSLVFKDNATTNKELQRSYIHDVQTATSIHESNAYGPHVSFVQGNWKWYICYPFAQDILTYNSIGDLSYDYDIQVALHKRQFKQPWTEEEERLKYITHDCVRFNPFQRAFLCSSPPQKHDLLFTRKATVKISSLGENLVTGGVLSTKGCMEQITVGHLTVKDSSEKDAYIFQCHFDPFYCQKDFTIIEVKIKTAN